MAGETSAERLTLISEVSLRGGAPLVLRRPVLVQPGQRYWLDEDNSALVVEDAAGGRCSSPCAYETGPDARR
ncbi:hypothetical protein [Micromonospora zamorensis]|uniref:hypothetical protein n=1 Tax=Micromonospora zamorensis TaxID=709883 RepID=UPI00340626AC